MVNQFNIHKEGRTHLTFPSTKSLSDRLPSSILTTIFLLYFGICFNIFDSGDFSVDLSIINQEF